MIKAILAGLFGTRAKATATGTATASVIAATVAFVGPWEGMVPVAYLDRIAQPHVWTVCYGETRGVRPGDTYTPQECADMLGVALEEYHAKVLACIPALANQPQGVQIALVSWTYNVGAGAACRSTLARFANAGDWRAACDQLLRWDKAGGLTVRGLTNRRQAERRLCLSAL